MSCLSYCVKRHSRLASGQFSAGRQLNSAKNKQKSSTKTVITKAAPIEKSQSQLMDELLRVCNNRLGNNIKNCHSDEPQDIYIHSESKTSEPVANQRSTICQANMGAACVRLTTSDLRQETSNNHKNTSDLHSTQHASQIQQNDRPNSRNFIKHNKPQTICAIYKFYTLFSIISLSAKWFLNRRKSSDKPSRYINLRKKRDLFKKIALALTLVQLANLTIGPYSQNNKLAYAQSYQPAWVNPPLEQEIFLLNLEDGYFGCQVNKSQDFLQLFELSRLCDGTNECFLGSDELPSRLKCNSRERCTMVSGTQNPTNYGNTSLTRLHNKDNQQVALGGDHYVPCVNGVCLDGLCYCNDGFGGKSCDIPDENECKYRPCDVFAHCTNTMGSYYCSCFPGKFRR